MILPNGFDYYPGFIPAEAAQDLLEVLEPGLAWRQFPIRIFGREHLQPRLTAWCSDEGIRYSYSGTRLEPEPWHPALKALRAELEMALGEPFNSVLANAYRNGQDAMGWHADDEPELGAEPLIASISLGQERVLRIRPRSGGKSLGIDLGHGSLLVMRGRSQAEWQHSIPRSRKPMGLRINLTYRRIYRE